MTLEVDRDYRFAYLSLRMYSCYNNNNNNLYSLHKKHII